MWWIFLLRVVLLLVQAATIAVNLAILYLISRYAGPGISRLGSRIYRRNRDAKKNKLSPKERERAYRLRKWDRRVKAGTGAERLEKETFEWIERVVSSLFSSERRRDREVKERNPAPREETDDCPRCDSDSVNPEGVCTKCGYVVNGGKECVSDKQKEFKNDQEKIAREEPLTGAGGIVREAERLLKKSKKKGLTKHNFKMEEMAAACILIACKEYHQPVLRAEVREEAGVGRKKFKNAHKLLCSGLSLPSFLSFRPEKLVGKIVSRLDIERAESVKTEAKKWCNRVGDHLGAVSSQKIAAISVLIAYNLVTSQRMTWSAAAKASDLSDQTVSRGVKKIGPPFHFVLNRRNRETATLHANMPRETQRIVETTIPGETRSSVEATIA